jgi:hypothetical protein
MLANGLHLRVVDFEGHSRFVSKRVMPRTAAELKDNPAHQAKVSGFRLRLRPRNARSSTWTHHHRRW